MKFRTNAVLLATLASASAWGQDVNVYGTTLAQLWKQEQAGFDKKSFAPATQFLGVDAVGLGSDTLSLHLFGWGRTDLADQSRFEGKSGGDLTFGYVKYRAPQANAEVQAGRFTVNQGVAIEQVDGVGGRADLIGGFTVSGFAGRPVRYKTVDVASQQEYDLQRDVLFGGRIGKRFSRYGEIGVSFVQDGTTPAQSLKGANTADYTRRQVAADIRFTPNSTIDFSGRTVGDAQHHIAHPVGGEYFNKSRVAEHDYNLGLKFTPMFTVNATYAQRNFRAYYSGTNLPSLFNPWEPGRFKSQGLAATVGSAGKLEAIIDYKKTDRESYGQATRIGGELRWRMKEGVQSGFGYHNVSADDVHLNGVYLTGYGLSYKELRAYVMAEKGKLSAAFDAIHHSFSDKNNPNLNGKTSVYEAVGSIGYQAATTFKISGDISYGVTPLLQKETRALLRAEYRFGMASKGGKK